MQKTQQLRWYEVLPVLPVLLIFIPSVFSVLYNPYGRITLNFLLFTMNFQSLTIVLTCFLFTTVYLLLLYKISFMDKIILTTATTVLATHFYETIHALLQLHVTGSTGLTLWILNIPVVLGLGTFLYFNGKKHNILHLNLWFLTLSATTLASFFVLVNLDFFLNPDIKSFPWALTKISTYAMWIPLFIGGKKNEKTNQTSN